MPDELNDRTRKEIADQVADAFRAEQTVAWRSLREEVATQRENLVSDALAHRQQLEVSLVQFRWAVTTLVSLVVVLGSITAVLTYLGVDSLKSEAKALVESRFIDYIVDEPTKKKLAFRVQEATTTEINNVRPTISQAVGAAVVNAQGEISRRVQSAIANDPLYSQGITERLKQLEQISPEDIARAAVSVPIGTILPFGGSKERIPPGWALCDGSPLPRHDFAALLAVIGDAWGKGDGESFSLPDLRGVFLRGVDAGRGYDPEVAGRRPSGRGTPDDVGSFQADSVGRHSHNIPLDHLQGAAASAASGSVGPFPKPVYPIVQPGDDQGPETRPKNVYVNFIIKAR